MVAGKAGGALRAGAHHSAPGDNATKVLLTLLRAMGLPLASYGKGNMQTTEEFTPLRA